MIRTLEIAARGLSRLLATLSAIFLLLMAFHITIEVIARYVFNSPIPGTLEFGSFYYMVAVSFLALGYGQMYDRHISVEFVVHAMPPRARMLTELVALVISAGFTAMYGYMSYVSAVAKTINRDYTVTQHFNLILWPSRWFLVVSIAALFLVLVVQALRILQALLAGEVRSVAGDLDQAGGAH